MRFNDRAIPCRHFVMQLRRRNGLAAFEVIRPVFPAVQRHPSSQRIQPKNLLDIFPNRNITQGMPRAATTSDAFNAVAEPRRRQILELLARGERPVNDVVKSLGIAQPQVSKHLGVLKAVGLVSMRGAGRHRLYRINGERLQAIHQWVQQFERFWQHQLIRVKQRTSRRWLNRR